MTLSISSLMEIHANEGFGRKKKHPHETNELFLRCQHAQDSQMGSSGPKKQRGAGGAGELRQVGWPRVLAWCRGGLRTLVLTRKS